MLASWRPCSPSALWTAPAASASRCIGGISPSKGVFFRFSAAFESALNTSMASCQLGAGSGCGSSMEQCLGSAAAPSAANTRSRPSRIEPGCQCRWVCCALLLLRVLRRPGHRLRPAMAASVQIRCRRRRGEHCQITSSAHISQVQRLRAHFHSTLAAGLHSAGRRQGAGPVPQEPQLHQHSGPGRRRALCAGVDM